MREGNKKAALLLNFQREPENFYLTVLLGNTIANGVFAIVLVLMLKEISSGLLFWSLFLLCVFTLFTFCDLLPKKLFSRFPDKLSLAVARPFRAVQITLTPFVSLIQALFGNTLAGAVGQPLAKRLFSNREELKKLMEDSDDSLSDEERTMISQVLRLSERTLGQAAIPLNLSVTASADSPISSVVDLCKSPYRPCPNLEIWWWAKESSRNCYPKNFPLQRRTMTAVNQRVNTCSRLFFFRLTLKSKLH